MNKWKITRDPVANKAIRPDLSPASIGTVVRVNSWGWNIRLTDVGMVGTVVKVNRTRLVVEVLDRAGTVFDVGEHVTVNPACLVVVEEMPEDADLAERAAIAEVTVASGKELRRSLTAEWRLLQTLAQDADEATRAVLLARVDEIDGQIADTFNMV